MATKDPWKQKASNLAHRCRSKGAAAVVWMDGHPVDDTSRVRAVPVSEAPDDESLVGVYGPEVGGPDIEADLLDDLARLEAKGADPMEACAEGGTAEGEGSGESLPEDSQEGSEAPTVAPEPQARDEPEPEEGADPDPSPAPAGPSPAADAPTVRDSRRVGEDQAEEGGPEAAGARYSATDVLGVRAELYELYAQAHRNGRPGRREVYQELIRRLETLEWQAQAQKKPAGAMG